MNINSFRIVATMALTMVGSYSWAQLDRVYPPEGSVISGTVTTILRDGVVVQVGGVEKKVPLEGIKRILFNREPRELSDARSSVQEEQYEAAATKLQAIDIAAIGRDAIKADALFFLAHSQAKLALAGRGDKSAAVKNLIGFVNKYSQSWHYYDACRDVGDLALALGSQQNAVVYYSKLASAKNAEYKLLSGYLVGWANLRMQKYDAASQAFAMVRSANVTSPEQLRLQKLAAAGEAAVAAGKGEPKKALASLDKLIAESDPSDSELFGRMYNAQGACFANMGDKEGAVLAYLKTHLMFQSDPETHAEALSELAELWGEIGHPERGTEARTILEKRYPGRK